jgi:hypothetical protein
MAPVSRQKTVVPDVSTLNGPNMPPMANERSAMDLVLLVGIGVPAALAAGVSARRAVLGNQMARSFETLKLSMRQSASRDDLVMRRAPVSGTVSIGVVRHGLGPRANNQEPPAEVTRAGVRHVPLHARRAS